MHIRLSVFLFTDIVQQRFVHIKSAGYASELHGFLQLSDLTMVWDRKNRLVVFHKIRVDSQLGTLYLFKK